MHTSCGRSTWKPTARTPIRSRRLRAWRRALPARWSGGRVADAPGFFLHGRDLLGLQLPHNAVARPRGGFHTLRGGEVEPQIGTRLVDRGTGAKAVEFAQAVLRPCVAALRRLFNPVEGGLVVLHHTAPRQQRQAVLILCFGESLFGGQRKPSDGFLVVLDHPVAFGVAHAQLQLRLGIALFGAAERQAGRWLGAGVVGRLLKCKPGGERDQRADGSQQHQGLERIEHPEAMVAVTTVQWRVQQQVAHAMVGVQGAPANFSAPAFWAGMRHGET